MISEYPLPSHTFIHDEVRGLRALGAHVETFSVRRTAAEQLLSDSDRELAREPTRSDRPARTTSHSPTYARWRAHRAATWTRCAGRWHWRVRVCGRACGG